MMAADHNELEGGGGMKHEAAQLNKRQQLKSTSGGTRNMFYKGQAIRDKI